MTTTQSLGDFPEIKMVALICGKPKLTVDITTLKSFINVVARNVKIEKNFFVSHFFVVPLKIL